MHAKSPHMRARAPAGRLEPLRLGVLSVGMEHGVRHRRRPADNRQQAPSRLADGRPENRLGTRFPGVEQRMCPLSGRSCAARPVEECPWVLRQQRIHLRQPRIQPFVVQGEAGKRLPDSRRRFHAGRPDGRKVRIFAPRSVGRAPRTLSAHCAGCGRWSDPRNRVQTLVSARSSGRENARRCVQ